MNPLQINLTHPNLGNVPWKHTRFPDGQQNVAVEWTGDHYEGAGRGLQVVIRSRMRNFSDLELILCATASLKCLGFEDRDVSLEISYFCGARSDRQFEAGGNNYLRDVICPVLNAQNYAKVSVLDPHSDVLEGCLRNFTRQSNLRLVSMALGMSGGAGDPAPILVSPDAGALKKVEKIAQELGVDRIVVGSKHRELKTGKITRTSVSGLDETSGDGGAGRYVIVDDICDGGRTFVELAKEIRSRLGDREPRARVELIVTHGIFSAGFEPFHGVIDKIYTTNSYQDLENDSLVSVFPVI